jgi:CRP-like cAMP-binding protein
MHLAAVRQEEVGNLLLASLPPEEFRQLAPQLTRVELKAGERLYEFEEVVSHIHFTEGGLLSLLTTLDDGASIEVSALGREGLGGLLVLLGSNVAAHTAVVRVGANALRMRTTQARECFERLPVFRARVLRYAHMLMSQVSQTTLCNTLHTVEQRLARWLLLARLRLGSDTIPVTHELISQLLGVRRSGVTVTIGNFEQAGLVSRGRGFVRVESHTELGVASCGCYGLLADEYGKFIDELATLKVSERTETAPSVWL